MVASPKTSTFAPVNVLWCNGSTTVFGSVSGGSSPSGTTYRTQIIDLNGLRSIFSIGLVLWLNSERGTNGNRRFVW